MKMDKDQISHTFAVCAYKESEYLEECVKSLLEQTVKTNIIMATSTRMHILKGSLTSTDFRCLSGKEKAISGTIGTLRIIQHRQSGLRLLIRMMY